MKVFAISDLHLSINNPKPMDIFGGAWANYVEDIMNAWDRLVSDGDIVLIAGDISWAMDLSGVLPDLDFISKLKGKKIILKGNHDYWWQSLSALKKELPYNMYAIQNDSIRIGDYLFCGSRGWTIPSAENDVDNKKLYDRELIRLKLSLDQMQKQRKDTDRVAVMTHYPPFDYSNNPSAVTKLIAEYSPDAVVYGHLHGKNCRMKKLAVVDGIPYYLTSCDQINNSPILIFE